MSFAYGGCKIEFCTRALWTLACFCALAQRWLVLADLMIYEGAAQRTSRNLPTNIHHLFLIPLQTRTHHIQSPLLVVVDKVRRRSR